MIVKICLFDGKMNEILAAISVILAILQVYWLGEQYNSIITKRSKSTPKNVSIVIAARNELENLKKLIPKLKDQTHEKEWELIIALDRCTDDSENYLREEQKSFSKLNFIVQNELDVESGIAPKKSALIKAIEASRYSLILQTDADCIPSSNFWIKEMTSSLKEGNVFVIGLSPYQKSNSFLNALIQFDTTWTTASMIHLATKQKAYMSLGRNQLFEKKAFLDKGGYGKNEKLLFGDDDLLIQNLDPKEKCDLCVTKESFMVSIPKDNWQDWLNQKHRHLMAGKHYTLKSLGPLVFNYLSFLLYLVLLLWIVLIPDQWILILSIWIFRTLIVIYFYKEISEKVGSKISSLLIPLLDLVHICLNFGIGLSTRLRKEVKWT